MRRSLSTLAAVALLANACGGGGSGGGGGITYVTQGAVTGFGTVTAAGTPWDTDVAEMNGEIFVDGAPAPESALAVGMKLTLEGGADSGDDAEASATRVEYDDDLQGRVESVTVVASDLDGPSVKELGILDRTVVILRGETLFDATGFDTIDPDDFVEVSGFEGDDGVIRASWVADRSAPDVELKGTVSDLDADSFMLGGVVVAYGPGTAIEGLPMNRVLENGDFVEVRGVDDGVLAVDATAGTIELEQRTLEGDVRNAEIEGLVADILAGAFLVGRQTVTVGLGTVFDPIDAMLGVGEFVEVEGRLRRGELQAERVTLRRGEARVAARIAQALDVDPMAGRFTLFDGELEVQVDAAARFDCEGVGGGIVDLETLAAEVALGTVFVDVQGVDLGGDPGVMRAVTIACSDVAGDVELRGRVAQFDPGPMTITVLGVAFPVAGASFENFPVPIADEGDFIGWLPSNPDALLDVRDEDDGDASDFDAADRVRLSELD